MEEATAVATEEDLTDTLEAAGWFSPHRSRLISRDRS